LFEIGLHVGQGDVRTRDYRLRFVADHSLYRTGDIGARNGRTKKNYENEREHGRQRPKPISHGHPPEWRYIYTNISENQALSYYYFLFRSIIFSSFALSVFLSCGFGV
jgi:hypothetical protein